MQDWCVNKNGDDYYLVRTDATSSRMIILSDQYPLFLWESCLGSQKVQSAGYSVSKGTAVFTGGPHLPHSHHTAQEILLCTQKIIVLLEREGEWLQTHPRPAAHASLDHTGFFCHLYVMFPDGFQTPH